MGRLELFLAIVILCVNARFSLAGDCVAIQGSMPVWGACKGPIQRSVMKLSSAEPFNSNCPAGKVSFYQDNDSTKPRCGQCVPGRAGVDDEARSCKLNEFCNDDAVCESVRTHPNFGKECPYEQGMDSSVGWCGAGLRCINHVCLPCEDGAIDYSDGKMCVFNEWTLSPWNRIFYEPTPALIGIGIVLVLSYGVISFFGDLVLHVIKRIKTRKNSHGLGHSGAESKRQSRKKTMSRRRSKSSRYDDEESLSDDDPSVEDVDSEEDKSSGEDEELEAEDDDGLEMDED